MGEDVKEFRVRGTSHTQYIWNATYINGLTKSAEDKIRRLKQAGYQVYTIIGDNTVRVTN